MAMYPVVNYPIIRPDISVVNLASVTISPTLEPAPMEADGDINLYVQASRIFGQLGSSNEFSGTVNSFRDVVARRVHVTSDIREKAALEPLDEARADALVRGTNTYRYAIDGRIAAGVLAHEVPPEYRGQLPDGRATVDYNSLLAELWTSVRRLLRRVDALEAANADSATKEVKNR